MHVIFHLIFAVGGLWLLTKEFGRKFEPLKHWGWLAVGVVFGVLAVLSYDVFSDLVANWILHSVGGGAVTALTYFYFKAHVRPKWSWRVDAVMLFMLVSALGLINELAEYAYELAHLGTMSFDTHDTWRDLVANSAGALLTWTIVSSLLRKNSNPASNKS